MKSIAMKVLAIVSGLGYGGAQVSTLEFFELLRDQVSLRVVVCKDADAEFINQLRFLGIDFKAHPCFWRGNLPHMDVGGLEDRVQWANVVWITDTEFSVAPRVKRIKRVPVVAHLRSYPLLCPWWGLLYGMREVCYEGCSLSRIVRCKQVFNEELSRLGILSGFRKSVYQALDLVKGPLDYFRWRKTVNRDLIDSIDGFIAVSNFVKRVHETLLPVEGKPIEVVYNPVTYPLKYVIDSKPRENHGGNPIVYASGSNPVKGPHLALQALKLLLNEGLNVKLVMFGCRGSWVEEHARKLGVGRSVIFLGKESFAKLYETISSANVVIMPSVWPEPLGRVPVEANRLGVMAVVTNRGGLPETVVEGETGFLAEVDPVDLAEKIRLSLDLDIFHKQIRETSLSVINPTKSLHTLLRFLETI
ncbi:MAG: glycosyltransferase family 4 protein [Desulfurococcaceae archaeon]